MQILSANQTWVQVCSDLWNNSYSDRVCHGLGYAGASTTESLAVQGNATDNGFYKLKQQQMHGAHLLTQLEKTDSCDNVVSITCQEFGKYWISVVINLNLFMTLF